MTIKIIDTSVVVLGEQHNPTILHPFFLESQGIVPSGWEDIKDQTFCTPAVSQVQYTNGIYFSIDPNKLQIRNQHPDEDPKNWWVADLAINYMDILRYVPYKSVGINFAAGIEREDPALWVINRFIKAGPWNQEELSLQDMGLKLQYSIENTLVNVSVSSGKFIVNQQTCVGIIFTINYHTDLRESAMLESAKSAITQFMNRREHFLSVAETLLR